MAIRVVFFDVAGTLLSVRGGVGAQYAAVARRFGVEASAGELDRLFPAAFRAAPPMAFPDAPPAEVPARERRAWHALVRGIFAQAGLFRDAGDAWFDDYFDAVYRHFEAPEVWAVYDDVAPLLAALRERGYRMGLITNFDGRLLTILDRLGLTGWFDSVTLSSRVGAAKPERAIFRHALDRHAVSAAEALHVGDSPEEDARGAAAAGLTAVLVDRQGRHSDAPGVIRVRSLGEVLRLL